MAIRTEELIAKFIKFRKVYEYVGCGELSQKKLLEYMNSLSATMARSGLAELEPFLVEKRQDFYAMDFELLGNVLHDFYKSFLPGIFTHERILRIAQQYMPEKLICDAAEVELDKQSYKFLYESLRDKYKDLEMDFHTQRSRFDECQRELADLNIELQNVKEGTGMYADSAQSLMRFIRNMIDKDIQVYSIYAADSNGEKIQTSSDRTSKTVPDDIADCPGVYGFMRPSWFTKLRDDSELNQKNAGRKVVRNTSPLLKEILHFWERIDGKKLPSEEKANAVDRRRHNEIVRLINDRSISNEEKYLKYMLLTPGMPKGYMKTLNGASELGLNAEIVIRLLEQPAESFNREIIEAYVSKAHKGTEYNLKQELAEELIGGKWTIRSSLNGVEEVYQLVPYGKLQELAGRFEKVYDALEKHSGTLCATVAQNVPDDKQKDEEASVGFDQAWEEELMRTGFDNEMDEDGEDFSGFDREAF